MRWGKWLALAVAGALIFAACSSGGGTPPTAAPTPTAAPIATATPLPPTATAALTPARTATSASQPTIAPTPTPRPAATPTPAPTPTSGPTPTPVPLTTYNAHRFVLQLDEQVPISVSGWTARDADDQQGVLSFPYKGVNAILVWLPKGESTTTTTIADMYDFLRRSQPSLTFTAASEGDITVSRTAGRYGGFRVADSSGSVVGGGLVGAWVCATPGTAFALINTGSDATVVQIRFQRLLDSFACPP